MWLENFNIGDDLRHKCLQIASNRGIHWYVSMAHNCTWSIVSINKPTCEVVKHNPDGWSPWKQAHSFENNARNTLTIEIGGDDSSSNPSCHLWWHWVGKGLQNDLQTLAERGGLTEQKKRSMQPCPSCLRTWNSLQVSQLMVMLWTLLSNSGCVGDSNSFLERGGDSCSSNSGSVGRDRWGPSHKFQSGLTHCELLGRQCELSAGSESHLLRQKVTWPSANRDTDVEQLCLGKQHTPQTAGGALLSCGLKPFLKQPLGDYSNWGLSTLFYFY